MPGTSASGRRPKPTALKILEGNPGHRPLNQHEPQATPGEPVMPKGMSKEAKREWKRVVPQLLDMGVLSVIDASALEAYCEAYAEFKQADKLIQTEGLVYTTAGGLKKRHPAVAIRADAQKRMKAFLCEFGMSPSSRTRLVTKDADTNQSNPWDELLNSETAETKVV